MAQIQTALQILRRKQVEADTGLARSTIYALMAKGKFPKNIPLGGIRAVGWLAHEVQDWVRDQIDQDRKAG